MNQYNVDNLFKYIDNEKVSGTAKDLTGQVFGRLTVIKMLPKELRKTRKTILHWICKCACGNEKVVCAAELSTGDTKSCGCLSLEIKRKADGEATWNKYYKTYIRSAKERNLVFELTLENFKEICSKDCYYCGESPEKRQTFGRRESLENLKRNKITVNGIDRVINSLGYIENNIVPCCHDCNSMKLARTKETFLRKIIKIYKNLELDKHEEPL